MLRTNEIVVVAQDPISAGIIPESSNSIYLAAIDGRGMVVVLEGVAGGINSVSGTIRMWGWSGSGWVNFQTLELTDEVVPAGYTICDKIDWEWLYIEGVGLTLELRSYVVASSSK